MTDKNRKPPAASDSVHTSKRGEKKGRPSDNLRKPRRNTREQNEPLSLAEEISREMQRVARGEKPAEQAPLPKGS